MSREGPWGSLGELCFLREDESVGGGRGVVAAQDIEPGTLVMSEFPLLSTPEYTQGRDTLHVALARKILCESDKAKQQTILDAVSHLHPVRLDDIPCQQLDEQRHKHSESVHSLMAEAGHNLSREEVLRLLLAIQCNAFYSGLYLNLALINHSCKPNCTKLSPGNHRGPKKPLAGGGASEVRAVRRIAAGEEIFISYLQPVEQSASRRQTEFREQHLWELGPSPHSSELESVLDKEECARIEDIMDNMPQHKYSPEQRLEEARNLHKEAIKFCGQRSLVLARLHGMLCSAAMEALQQQEDPSPDLAVDVVRWSLDLLQAQEEYLGPEHLDVGATCADLADALDFLLSAGPKLLFAAFPAWDGFSSASKAQHKFLKRAQKISLMYGR